jgi:hypothetical protein
MIFQAMKCLSELWVDGQEVALQQFILDLRFVEAINFAEGIAEDNPFDVPEQPRHAVDTELIRGSLYEITHGTDPGRNRFCGVHEMAEYGKEQKALPERKDPCSAACISEGAAAGIEQVDALISEEERNAIGLDPVLPLGATSEEPAEYSGNVAAAPYVERLEQEHQ